MYSGGSSNNPNSEVTPELEIYLHARKINLVWRFEILTKNNIDPTSAEILEKMEDDIFWDLAEIDRENGITKSLRLTSLNLKELPENLTKPFNSQILDLSNNSLSNIPRSWFQHMKNLKILRIANNLFTQLPWEGISMLDRLKVLDLRGNPWDEEFIDKFKSYCRMFEPEIRQIYW